MDGILSDRAFDAVSYALNGLSLRQQVLSNDIANISTPGFRSQDVSFESQLQQMLNTGDSMNMADTPATLQPQIITPADPSLSVDQNNVNVDSTMSRIAETTLNYEALSQLATSKLSLMKSIISGAH